MSYDEDQGGRIGGLPSGFGSMWTYDLVQERLVDAMRLWWRSPGGGRWPFAGDAPWWMIRAEWADYPDPDAPPRPLPLSRAQIAERDEASEWLRMVPDRDRKLVVLALVQLASGHKRVRWSRVREQISVDISRRGLGQRYSRALAGIARALNGAGNCAATTSSL